MQKSREASNEYQLHPTVAWHLSVSSGSTLDPSCVPVHNPGSEQVKRGQLASPDMQVVNCCELRAIFPDVAHAGGGVMGELAAGVERDVSVPWG